MKDLRLEFTFIFLLFSLHFVNAQVTIIENQISENLFQFDVNLPDNPNFSCPQIPLEDRFIYYWEFGDGGYSFEKNPVHFFEEDTVQFFAGNTSSRSSTSSNSRTVKVEVTEIYDDDDIFEDQRSVSVTYPPTVPNPFPQQLIPPNTLRVQISRAAIPSPAIPNPNKWVNVIVSYSQLSGPPNQYIGFNFPDTLFIYNQSSYSNCSGASVNDNNAVNGELTWNNICTSGNTNKNFFIKLDCKNGTQGQSGFFNILLNDSPSSFPIRIDTSYDPNIKQVDYDIISGQQQLTYTIHFQNTGEGPVSDSIVVADKGIPEFLDYNCIDYIEIKMGNTVVSADRATDTNLSFPQKGNLDLFLTDIVYVPLSEEMKFVLAGPEVYLAGTNNPNFPGVCAVGTTTGYVKYRISTHNIDRDTIPSWTSFGSNALIYFDENPPVSTNHAFTTIAYDCPNINYVIDNNPIQSGNYYADSLTIISRPIAVGAIDTLLADDCIEMEPEFEVPLGSEFVAQIAPCPNTLTTFVNTYASCNGSTGSIIVSMSGGAPPYSYAWSHNSEETGNCVEGLSMDTYQVTVTDANGNTVAETITIKSSPSIVISTNAVVNLTCNTTNDGSIDVTAVGGTPPLTYSWSNGMSGTTTTGLNPGVYVVSVTDAVGCVVTSAYALTSLSTNAFAFTNESCDGALDGSAVIIASDGAMPYTYMWSNGSTSSAAPGIGAGTYYVTTTDDNNCQVVDSVVIGLDTFNIQLDIKVLLEGAIGTLPIMRNDLRFSPNANPQWQNIIPSSQTYSVAPWNYSGTESADFNSLPTDIVDWLLVSLRTDYADPASQFAQEAVLLKTDGQVIDTSGATILDFPTTACFADSVFLVIEHRNHLATIEEVTPVSGVPLVVDLRNTYNYPPEISTTDSTRVELGSGYFGMYAGNGEQIITRDSINSTDDLTPIMTDFNIFGIYSPGDYNMDGDVNANDTGVLAPNVGKKTLVPF